MSALKKIYFDKNIYLLLFFLLILFIFLYLFEVITPFVIEVIVISITKSRGRIKVKFMGNRKTFFQAAFEKKLNFKNFNSRQYILSN